MCTAHTVNISTHNKYTICQCTLDVLFRFFFMRESFSVNGFFSVYMWESVPLRSFMLELLYRCVHCIEVKTAVRQSQIYLRLNDSWGMSNIWTPFSTFKPHHMEAIADKVTFFASYIENKCYVHNNTWQTFPFKTLELTWPVAHLSPLPATGRR